MDEEFEMIENPREDDNLGVMVCFHRRYRLGDKHEFTLEQAKKFEASGKAAVCLEVYLYDHSGLRIKVGSFQGLLPAGHAEFDSGKVGFIYTTKKRILQFYGGRKVTPEQVQEAERQLRREVEEYDRYLRQ